VLYSAEVRGWLVADWVSPQGLDARIHLTFSPSIEALEIETSTACIQLCNKNGQYFWVCPLQAAKPEITPGWVSGGYGEKQASLQAEFCFTGAAVQYWTLLPEMKDSDLEARNKSLLNIWEQLKAASLLEG
jgi:hypothetical protein